MSILFVFDGKIIPSNGGVERVTLLLARELVRRGHNVSFLSVSGSHEGYDSDYGIPQYSFPRESHDFKVKFENLVRKENILHIIFQGTHVNVFSILDLVPSKIKKYVVLHNQPHAQSGKERKIMRLTPWRDLTFRQKALKLLTLMSPSCFRYLNNKKNGGRYRKIISRADKFLFLSERYIFRISQITKVTDLSKLGAINNPNTFLPQKEEAAEKDNLLIFVGRLSNPQKNVLGFIDVWKLLADKYPDWKAVIIGDGEHRKQIEEYASKRGVRRIAFAGNQKNIEEYYRKAKILCMTSTYEGWPMVLAEAMAYGCVPVAYETFEAVHDIIEDKINGFVITPFLTKKMAAAIERLIDNEILLEEFSRNGKEKIADFSVENIVDRWERLLDSNQ